ncbi:hypothetical protein F4780DRAFT_404320 [Xylariomycetidae sp. FL0641]|nr:hypothetical protein F4780DRAFT_404320 [Xylariomycetidae sp. FL0641]
MLKCALCSPPPAPKPASQPQPFASARRPLGPYAIAVRFVLFVRERPLRSLRRSRSRRYPPTHSRSRRYLRPNISGWIRQPCQPFVRALLFFITLSYPLHVLQGYWYVLEPLLQRFASNLYARLLSRTSWYNTATSSSFRSKVTLHSQGAVSGNITSHPLPLHRITNQLI